MIDTYLIEEIATKECERYELEKNGFVSSRKAMAQALLSEGYAPLPSDSSSESFSEWKEQLLDGWYRKTGFLLFFQRKAGKRCIIDLVKRMYLNTVLGLRKKQLTATIDDELRLLSGRTVAFKLSSPLFTALYADLRSAGTSFISPGKLEGRCVEQIRNLYPLDYPAFYKRLQLKDNEFWEELWVMIRRFVAYLLADTKGEKENLEEVSMEAVLSFQEQMDRGKLNGIVSASHLLHSLRKTCRNKLFEHFRGDEKRQSEVRLGKEGWQILEGNTPISPVDEKVSEQEDGRFSYLLEVNEKSEYDVSCALVDVLCFGKGEVYESLVDGMQDKIQLLTMLYLDGDSYEEIAQQWYGEVKQSQVVSLRKTASRAKEYLKKRMAGLIAEYKWKECVPFVTEE